MTDAIIVDVDGTVALHFNRSPFDWSRVGEDVPNRHVIHIVEAVANTGVDVIFCSGRSDICRSATERWLAENIPGINPAALFMRSDGDYRPDHVIKAEIFERDIRPQYNIVAVFDDRDQVVEMWRSLGLTCLQVAPGNF